MPKRHEEYYFDDGAVVLLVEDTLFRVHRYYLTRESQIFADMFSLPVSETAEGNTDSSPIRIPGVTVKEMESFLTFMYFGMHDERAPTLESWVSLLSFSTRFVCDRIRARSVRELEAVKSQMGPVELAVLAARHDISQWLSEAHSELCQRKDPLSEEEGERLGLPTVIKLMRAREALRSRPDDRHRWRRPGRTPSIEYTPQLRTRPGWNRR